jgi:hypothetical protein
MDSRSLKATPYSINNYLEYGNGQGIAGGRPTTTGLYEGHNYTLVDNRTDTILAQGSTPEAIQKIQDIANNLSATQGQKADWRLYDASPETGITNMHESMPGAYLDLSAPGDPRGVVVAGNMPNDIFKDYIGPILGTMGPLLASAFIPGLNLTPLGNVAAGAAVGGAGAGLRGENILKGAAMGGLGAAGGQYLGPVIGDAANIGLRAGTAIGTGLGSAAGGLLTGQNLKDALTGGVVSGGLSYLSPDISKGLGIGGGSSANTSTGGDGGGDIVVSGYRPTSIGTSLGGSQNKIQQALTPKTETPYDGLSVTGNRVGGTFGVNTGGDRFGTPGSDTSAFEKMYEEPYDPNEILVKATPTTQASSVSVPVTGGLSPDVVAGVAEFAKNPIVAEGSKIEQATPVSVPVTGGLSPDVVAGVAEFAKNPIVAEGSKIEQATPGGFTIPQTDLEVLKKVSDMETEKKEDIVVTGTDKTTPVAVTVDTDLGTKSVTDTLPKLEADPELTDKDGKKLNLAEALRLAALAAGLIDVGKGGGSTGTYGGTGTGRLNPIFSAKLPAVGGLGNIGATRTKRALGDVDWLTYGTRPELDFFDYARPATPAPVTTPVPGNPAGPIMVTEENPRMAEGGAFAAKGGGRSRRTEFAVNGAGTGRSDDIPAVLSDGEYVIDAETVALLGDGSSKAGAKKLDELRVKVRKHKGQKLAKGRFSANAKRPEAYLSGGRI